MREGSPMHINVRQRMSDTHVSVHTLNDQMTTECEGEKTKQQQQPLIEHIISFHPAPEAPRCK